MGSPLRLSPHTLPAMVQVIVQGTVIADSNSTVVVEGNHYFPPTDVKTDIFTSSSTSSACPWKGTAAYYNANVDGTEIRDIAWQGIF
ncbi:hypothetical protein EVG20_g3308 [Dentipellis fragilis]|uniref:DUF427 domain-containing protein n=1 Tax=Dentipellis fragilis TaxID=205917 RepID=A0A4Y9Z3D3_9AGAM|nr:hypothetical protein EVG20_g3308 [Dentipellis fragilis]